MHAKGQYAPIAVANTFLKRHGGVGGIEHMKAAEAVYFAHGWWLAAHTNPILSECPEVWRHGPVFNGLYHQLKDFGRRPIKEAQPDLPFSEPPLVPESDEKTIGLIDWIWSRYGNKSAFALSDETHKVGTPWREIAEEREFRVPMHTEIDNERIRSFLKKEAASLGWGSD